MSDTGLDWVKGLILGERDVIVTPVVLIREFGDLNTAAFLRQAAYLSAVVWDRWDGWFFLAQVGEPEPSGVGEEEEKIFKRLGSWKASLGLGLDGQVAVRKKLRALGLLEETRKGLSHGVLHYKVDLHAYARFFSACSAKWSGRNPGAPAVSEKKRPEPLAPCANPAFQIDQSGNPGMINREFVSDIEEVDLKKVNNASLSNARVPRARGGGGRDWLCRNNWNGRDQTRLQKLIAEFGEEVVMGKALVLAAANGGTPPFLSAVADALDREPSTSTQRTSTPRWRDAGGSRGAARRRPGPRQLPGEGGYGQGGAL